MFDHDEDPPEPDDRPAVDWDAWEKNRFTGFTRWWMILMLATAATMAIGFLVNGTSDPFGSR